MAVSIAEQLAPIRPTMGPIVQDVLALQADLSGGDASSAVEAARHETLRWMAHRDRVGHLPDAAWRFESFDQFSEGNKAWGTRLVTDSLDWWAARCDIFTAGREDGISRSFTTEVSIVRHGARGRLAVHQSVATHEGQPATAPTVPGLVRQLATMPGLVVDGHDLAERPWLVDCQGADDLVDLIEDRDRQLPVVVVSLGEGENDPASAVIAVDDCSKKVLGLAHYAVVTGPATFALTERWGNVWSCFRRAVRIYWPGFDRDEQSPYDHPLFLPSVIEAWPQRYGVAFEERLKRELGSASLRRLRPDREIPRFAKVRQAALEEERSRARAAGRSDAELLRLVETEVAGLKQQLAESTAQTLEHLEEEEARTRAADERAKEAEARYAALLRWKDAQQKRNVSVQPSRPSPPATLDELSTWCEDHLVGSLILTGRAAHAAKKGEFRDLQIVGDALLLLAREYRDWRIQGEPARQAYEGELERLKLYNEPTGGDVSRSGDEFFVSYEGTKRVLDMHLKNGGNTRDPKRCFRLYYFWDEDKRLCVIGSLPGHLRTGAT